MHQSLTPHQIIPDFAQRVLQIGALPLSLADLYAQRALHLQVRITESLDDSNAESCSEGADVVIFSLPNWNILQIQAWLRDLRPTSMRDGRVTLIFQDADPSNYQNKETDLLLSQLGWVRYQEGFVAHTEAMKTIWGMVLVLQDYNPVTHAQTLAEQGRPDHALTLLADIPESLLLSEDNLALLAVEKQRYYLKWQQLLHNQVPTHAFFSKERREFAQATTLMPLLRESYHIHSRFWSHIGRNDMALRTLRSIQHVCPDNRTGHLLQVLQHQEQVPLPEERIDQAGTYWQDSWPAPRILFISHGTSDYGQDTLFHGLCSLLGKEKVVEYPWKPTLHGLEYTSANSYPCVFNYPGNPLTLEELLLQLQAGCFDLILFSDILGMVHQTDIRQIMAAAPELPVVLYDAWDDCYTPVHTVLEYIGRSKVDLIFKREMLSGIKYGTQTFPLPFGYPETLSSQGMPYSQRSCDAPFWAGRNEFGLRPLYVQQLERITGHALQTRFDQDSYRVQLRSRMIGLSFFGVGFDTVRYWEIPANGGMLLAERPPTRIPENFEDGISAVFFEDLPELEYKLNYYLNHPDQAAEIAINGHAHYLKHHTTTARARYFLGMVFQHLFTQPDR